MLGGRQRVKRGGGAVHTFGATVDNHAHFWCIPYRQSAIRPPNVPGIDHHHDVTDTPATLERLDAPAHDGLKRPQRQAAWGCRGQSGCRSRPQHHGLPARSVRVGRLRFRDIGVSLSHSHHRKGGLAVRICLTAFSTECARYCRTMKPAGGLRGLRLASEARRWEYQSGFSTCTCLVDVADAARKLGRPRRCAKFSS